MNDNDRTTYDLIRSGGSGFFEQKRGLIGVWGSEAVSFLDGMVTNDMKTLEDGAQMLAAFPNAQGRLLAVVRVLRQGDRFLFETEEATREKVFQNLFRFTFAGEFFVEDLSEGRSYFEIFGDTQDRMDQDHLVFNLPYGSGYFVSDELAKSFRNTATADFDCVPIDDELYETLRVETGIPKYGVDMDEDTIVPELGLDGLISYNKGCYIGQEIIARIHFRGHVAKQLTGLAADGDLAAGKQLTSFEGKPAGRITSVAYSPKLGKTIALAFVRYDYLGAGTELLAGDTQAVVTALPFVE